MLHQETIWINVEETDGVHDEPESTFLEDPLKPDPELNVRAGSSEDGVANDPLGNSWATDYIKEEPSLNLEEDETENTKQYEDFQPTVENPQSPYWVQDDRHLGDTAPARPAVRRPRPYHCSVCGNWFLSAAFLRRHYLTETHKQRAAKEEQRTAPSGSEVHHCTTCRLSFASAAYRDRHQFYCRRRCKSPSKVSCATAIKPVHGVLSDTELRLSSTKSYASKILDNTNTNSCIRLNPCSQAHSGKEHLKCNYDWGTNMDGLESTQNDTDISSGLTAYGVKDKIECSEGHETYSDTSNLNNHERIHTGESPYKCGTCNKAYSRSAYLHIHQRIHTGERPYKCKICNKAFSQLSYLYTHERFHTGERPYKCSTCNEEFSLASSLRRHVRIHTGERPYKCDVCNKAFTQALDLHRHKRIHTGERPYKCTTCNEAFSVPSALRRHVRIHTGERPYKCSTCNMAFAQVSDLHRHKVIHTGERPYQ